MNRLTSSTLISIALVAFLICVFITPTQALTLAPGTPLPADYVTGPTTPGKWGSPVFGTGATVTWSLMGTGITIYEYPFSYTSFALADFMPVGYLNQIEAAFSAWSDVADITFIKVDDEGEPFNAPQLSGDIRLAGHDFDGPSGVLAHGYYPPNNGDSAAGDIHFDRQETWKIGFGGSGFDIFQIAAHEIGHSIGLGHEESVVALMNPYYTEVFSGPQADDINGAQYIYGPSQIPEPTSLVLFTIGIFGMAGYAWWRRKRAA